MSEIFFSYSHKDEDLRDKLEIGCAQLKNEGLVSFWHDRRIQAGDNFGAEIDLRIEQASIILLLVSPDFLDSGYCYGLEMSRALERHRNKLTRVIPVILRPCEWLESPLKDLQAVPKDGLPFSKYADVDDAILEVAQAIRKIIKEDYTSLTSSVFQQHIQSGKISFPENNRAVIQDAYRSSNLHVRKDFSELEKDDFLEHAFCFMGNSFERSLGELSLRSPEVKTRYKKSGEMSFEVSAYRNETKISQARIYAGNDIYFQRSIKYSNNAQIIGNSYNESLAVDHDGQMLGLRLSGLGTYMNSRFDQKLLSVIGAFECYWEKFMKPLQ